MKQKKHKSVFEISDKKYEEIKKKAPNIYRNCKVCRKRVVLTLCKYPKTPEIIPAYCWEHCPEHKWQTDYDWATECGICGIHYDDYLERVLDKHKIPFTRNNHR